MSTIQQANPGGLSLQSAVELAKQYLETVSDEQLLNLRLEEVERDKQEGVWRITLGYDRIVQEQLSPQNSLSAILGTNRPLRAYRVISLDDVSGEFLSMKLREL